MPFGVFSESESSRRDDMWFRFLSLWLDFFYKLCLSICLNDSLSCNLFPLNGGVCVLRILLPQEKGSGSTRIKKITRTGILLRATSPERISVIGQDTPMANVEFQRHDSVPASETARAVIDAGRACEPEGGSPKFICRLPYAEETGEVSRPLSTRARRHWHWQRSPHPRPTVVV